ncbi:ABC transporter substrate-binding protein [Prescottella subtropica]|uniref:ABC transporter substrate-binding protein n=1 Tax=Prescottella subtropica TaxID=2545757 RepID=UPI0010F7E6A2|nr:ABC transporter substrate-binding protein [Prescottella subtropica]
MNNSIPTTRTGWQSVLCAGIVTVAAAVAVAGCSSSTADTRSGPTDDHLTIYNSYKIAGLDPVATGTNWLFDWGIAENLLQVDEDGTISPWLAESVERRDDLTWAVELRDGQTFQNGTPVTAQAVAAALSRQIDRSKAAQVYLQPGTRAVAEDDDTVLLHTPTPNAMVPAGLAARDNSLQIYDVEAVEAAGGDSAKIVGSGAYTGPYAITAWTPTDLELARYDGYWQGTPALAGISVDVVPDEQARIAGVESGEADMAFYPSTGARLALSGRDDVAVKNSPEALQSLLVEMNLKQGIFTDVDVRKAFVQAIDYQGLADNIGNGSFDAAEGLYPQQLSFALGNQKYDVESAKALLDKAGWVPGADGVRTKDGQRLTVRFVTQAQGPETTDVAIGIQDQVARAGFELKIDVAEDSAAVKENPAGWESSIALSGSLSGTADPVQPYLVRWTTGGSSNMQGLSNPEIDAIGDTLRSTFDDGERDALLKRAQEILVTEQAYVVAGTFKYFTVVTSQQWSGYEVSNVRRHIRYDTGA